MQEDRHRQEGRSIREESSSDHVNATETAPETQPLSSAAAGVPCLPEVELAAR
jgi:hypothetical protein